MAGKRKTPRLRFDGRYFVANIYRPNGSRTMISFGPLDGRTEGEIYIAFGKWLDLYNRFPQKVLSYRSPYDAIEQVINPSSKMTVGEVIDQYVAWVRKTTESGGRINDIVRRTDRIKRFTKEYHGWPIGDLALMN